MLLAINHRFIEPVRDMLTRAALSTLLAVLPVLAAPSLELKLSGMDKHRPLI
jgi:hypothetical protein